MTRGVWIILTSPQLSALPCAKCKAWVVNEDWTLYERGGKNQRRPLGTVPPCHICPKIPQGDEPVPESAVELTPQLYRAYVHYRRCRAVGRFPDDDLVEDNARIFLAVEEQVESSRMERIELSMRTLGAVLGGLFRG